MQLIYTIYGIKAISNDINGGYHTAVILYPTYERMNNHSYNAAYSQLYNLIDNASVNPCLLRMFINKKLRYLRSMVRVAVFTCVYTLTVYRCIQTI